MIFSFETWGRWRREPTWGNDNGIEYQIETNTELWDGVAGGGRTSTRLAP